MGVRARCPRHDSAYVTICLLCEEDDEREEQDMISKGDLVRMRLTTGGAGEGATLRDLLVLGKVMNYCEEEDTYVIDTRVICVPKEQVVEIETLPADFDFEDVSVEMGMATKQTEREKPPEISGIRFAQQG